MGDGPTSGPPPRLPSQGLSARLPRRRTWILVGRTLGGFGAFIAAIIAGLQFALGGDEGGSDAGRSLPAYEFVRVSDATGAITVDLPTAWADTDGRGWRAHDLEPFAEDELIGPGLSAATNVRAWGTDLAIPGVFIGVSKALLPHYTPASLSSRFSYDGCEIVGREPYAGRHLTGELEHWECDGSTRWTVLAASPPARDYLVLLQATLVSQRDDVALERILDSLETSLA